VEGGLFKNNNYWGKKMRNKLYNTNTIMELSSELVVGLGKKWQLVLIS
jgi:hypothetical protein